jgi:hypothetical protein
MGVQRKVFIRREGWRTGRVYLAIDEAAQRLMHEASEWRGESPAAFLHRALANAIAREHAAVAAEKAWGERPYDEC